MTEETKAQEINQEITELKAALDAKERQNKELVERLQRLAADFENYKKRVARDNEEIFRRLEDALLLEILPIYDNFERAFRTFTKNNDKDSFIEGVERIFAQFHTFLTNKGVQPIPALGETFDPLLHEALITVETTEAGGKVLEEFERGYQRSGRVLRPSKVKVSRHVDRPASDAEPSPHRPLSPPRERGEQG
ncbi:MAG: nucleotide exchange factor GrpE [Candidatus Bipolaricaulota bacterium]|nr:nucleotide exchange factor GrpE [Candidatus Bipolaricaulota bacterium]